MEPKRSPLDMFKCIVSLEVVDNAVRCMQCKHLLCERHRFEFRDCPFCRAKPLRVEVAYKIRQQVDHISIQCQFCRQYIKRGALNDHLVNHCPQQPRVCAIETGITPQKCGVNGCGFQSCNKEEGLQHIIYVHGDKLWENYNRLTATSNISILL